MPCRDVNCGRMDICSLSRLRSLLSRVRCRSRREGVSRAVEVSVAQPRCQSPIQGVSSVTADDSASICRAGRGRAERLSMSR